MADRSRPVQRRKWCISALPQCTLPTDVGALSHRIPACGGDDDAELSPIDLGLRAKVTVVFFLDLIADEICAGLKISLLMVLPSRSASFASSTSSEVHETVEASTATEKTHFSTSCLPFNTILVHLVSFLPTASAYPLPRPSTRSSPAIIRSSRRRGMRPVHSDKQSLSTARTSVT